MDIERKAGVLARAAAWLAKQVELALVAEDLTATQYRVLGLLGEGSKISSSLADRLAVRPSSVTGVVDGLVARGLVARCQVAGDRRRVSHVITAEGLRVLESADLAVDQRLVTLSEMLAPEEAARARSDLALWLTAMARRAGIDVEEPVPGLVRR